MTNDKAERLGAAERAEALVREYETFAIPGGCLRTLKGKIVMAIRKAEEAAVLEEREARAQERRMTLHEYIAYHIRSRGEDGGNTEGNAAKIKPSPPPVTT